MFVKPKPITAYPWYIRLFFAKQKRTYGKVLEPGMLWARAPSVFIGVALLYGAINRRRSPLSAELRSLVTVRVSQINHCVFCVDINAATLLKRGASEEKVAALADWRNGTVFSDLERCALEFTESMTITNKRVEQALIDDLHQHFDDDGISELAGVIAFQNLSSKFNSALDMPTQGFCQLPDIGIEGDVAAISRVSDRAG